MNWKGILERAAEVARSEANQKHELLMEVTDERDAARAEVERWRQTSISSNRKYLEAMEDLEAAEAERDAAHQENAALRAAVRRFVEAVEMQNTHENHAALCALNAALEEKPPPP